MRPNDRAWRPSAAAFLLAAAILPAVAADKPCSSADAANAEKAIDRVTSWAALQKAVRDFGHCDKGQAGEYFSEALMRVLISGWPQIRDAEPILDKDAAFREWLLNRLASPTLAKDDADSIRGLAKGSCPKGRDKLCADLLAGLEAGKITAPKLMEWPAAAPAKPAEPAKDNKK
jgi:hypothetical protein